MPALDRLRGMRVVADSEAIDGARWAASGDDDDITVLRLAPDDVLVLGADIVALDDPDAIVEEERGFVGAWCSIDDLRPHVEWTMPTHRPALAQGSIAGVPAKVWLPGRDRPPGPGTGGEVAPRIEDPALVLTADAYADVLTDRLGWRS